MNKLLYDDLDAYINELTGSPDFKEMLRLKALIDEKYIEQVAKMQMAKERYFEAMKYQEYYTNFNELRDDYQRKKQELFSLGEVKRYIALERKIDNELKDISNQLAASMSNKFNLLKIYK